VIIHEAIAATGTEIIDYLDRDASIPTVTTAACQGDVSILRVTTSPATTPVPPAGVAVVRGESGGNTHSLHAAGGAIFWDTTSGDGVALGTLTVPAGCTALLAHPEHGYLEIQPGTYRIGRQREQADEISLVAD
jgi:hypothetical protein